MKAREESHRREGPSGRGDCRGPLQFYMGFSISSHLRSIRLKDLLSHEYLKELNDRFAWPFAK